MRYVYTPTYAYASRKQNILTIGAGNQVMWTYILQCIMLYEARIVVALWMIHSCLARTSLVKTNVNVGVACGPTLLTIWLPWTCWCLLITDSAYPSVILHTVTVKFKRVQQCIRWWRRRIYVIRALFGWLHSKRFCPALQFSTANIISLYRRKVSQIHLIKEERFNRTFSTNWITKQFFSLFELRGNFKQWFY